jgi:hypothetical protein
MLSCAVTERYRCPASFWDFQLSGEISSDEGYFRFGENAICYGRSCSGTREASIQSVLYDGLRDTIIEEAKLKLPFDPTEVIENLRLERYAHCHMNRYDGALKKLYYQLRPFTNQWLRKRIQRFHARNWRKLSFPRWPVDTTV